MHVDQRILFDALYLTEHQSDTITTKNNPSKKGAPNVQTLSTHLSKIQNVWQTTKTEWDKKLDEPLFFWKTAIEQGRPKS